MLVLETPQEIKAHVGEALGYSDWVTIDQVMIDKFADATGDRQWIHVDVERAKTQMPGGKTIAHGQLLLSLWPTLGVLWIKKRSRGINLGFNTVRFTKPVPSGSRVRLKGTLKKVNEFEDGGVQVTLGIVMEVEGETLPSLVAEVLYLVYP